MKNPIIKITHFSDYTNEYQGNLAKYFQIHTFSVPEIISVYYDPEFYKEEQINNIAESVLSVLRKKSVRKDKITLFKVMGKFLISEHNEFLDPGEIMIFNKEQERYEYSDPLIDFITFLGNTKADVFIKNALTSVGARVLYSIVEPHVKKLCQTQERINSEYTTWRELNKTNPLLKLEIYRIEKNYVPVKINELLCNSYESALFLPEHDSIINSDKRITYLLIDIASNKIIEGNINEFIENIKYNKWLRKHPPLIDMDALHCMELDNDDPDFLSYDNYIKNNDEYEEGDDEYSPDFNHSI